MWGAPGLDAPVACPWTHEGGVQACIEIQDGRIVTAGSSGLLAVWDQRDRRPSLLRETGSGDAVLSLCELRDERVVVGSSQACVELWDLRMPRQASLLVQGQSMVSRIGQQSGDVPLHLEPVRCLTELRDGALAVGAGRFVWLYQCGALECTDRLEGHTDEVSCLAELQDRRLLSGAEDYTMRVWNVAAGACEGVLTGHGGAVSCLLEMQDGRVVSGSEDYTLKWWDVQAELDAVQPSPPGHTTRDAASESSSAEVRAPSPGRRVPEIPDPILVWEVFARLRAASPEGSTTASNGGMGVVGEETVSDSSTAALWVGVDPDSEEDEDGEQRMVRQRALGDEVAARRIASAVENERSEGQARAEGLVARRREQEEDREAMAARQAARTADAVSGLPPHPGRRWDEGMWEEAYARAERDEARWRLRAEMEASRRPPSLNPEGLSDPLVEPQTGTESAEWDEAELAAATNASLHAFFTDGDPPSPPVPHPVAPSMQHRGSHRHRSGGRPVAGGLVDGQGMPEASIAPPGAEMPIQEDAEDEDEDLELASDAPEQYLCAITGTLMRDPVATADGHIYERRAIEKWLQRNSTSPMTGLPLPHKEVMPIFALKSLIEDFKRVKKKG